MAIQAINTHMQQINTAVKAQATNNVKDEELFEPKFGAQAVTNNRTNEEITEKTGGVQQANTVNGRKNVIDILA